MVNLRQIVNKFLIKKGIKLSGGQQGRLEDLERKINKIRQDATLSEVISALESEFSYNLDRNDYREIEKAIKREMGKIY